MIESAFVFTVKGDALGVAPSASEPEHDKVLEMSVKVAFENTIYLFRNSTIFVIKDLCILSIKSCSC